jgi:hypothetical protein
MLVVVLVVVTPVCRLLALGVLAEVEQAVLTA